MILIFLYLLLAHLVADFLLQPAELIKWKYRNWKGIAVHTFVHLAIYLVSFYLVLKDIRALVGLGLLALSHFLIDKIKVAYELEKKKGYLKSYLYDQLAHFIFILLATWQLGRVFNGNELILENSFVTGSLLVFLCLLIVVTVFMEITKYQIKREKDLKVTFNPDRKAMLIRALLVCVIYSGFMALILK